MTSLVLPLTMAIVTALIAMALSRGLRKHPGA